MFQNPIQTKASAPQSGVVEQPSPVPNALMGIAEAGLRLWTASKEGEADKKVAKANEFGFQLGTTRLQEFNELKEERGQVTAQRWLRDKYLEDVKDLDPTARSSYMEGVKAILGSTPVDMENDQAVKRMEAEQEEQRKLLTEGAEWVAGSGVDPSDLSDEDLMWIAMQNRGKAAQRAAQQSQLSIQSTQLNIESTTLSIEQTKKRKATEAALGMFGAAFDTRIGANIFKIRNAVRNGRYSVPVINPETGIMEPSKQWTGQEAIEKAREDAVNNILEAQTQLPALMRASVREMGGDPALISQADISQMQDYLDRVRNFITGAEIGKMRGEQFDALLNILSLDYLQNASDHGMELAIAKVTGAPMASQDVVMASRLKPEGTVSLGDPTTSFLRDIDNTYRYGPASAARSASDPKAAVGENTNTVIAGLSPNILDDEVRRARTADMVYRSLSEAASNDPTVSLLANGQNGVIKLHRELAKDPEKAKKLSEDLIATAERHGTTLDALYAQEINNVTRKSIIPSLGLSGLSRGSDLTGKDVISVEVDKGQVRFKLKGPKPDTSYQSWERQPVTKPARGSREDHYRSGWNERVIKLQKAERDLNTILMSYKNTTGADGAELAEAAVAAFREVLGQDVEENGEQ